VLEVDSSGEAGDADGLVTTTPGLPLVVFTADCLGIVIDASSVVGVVHGGWRGLDAGVIESGLSAIRGLGGNLRSAWIGPSIGPCCFEVGEEVAERFPGHVTKTTWGTTSVDLRAVAESRLGVEATVDRRCTRCGPGLFSHRADGTSARLAAVGWLER
jgi:YfiH family protein